MKLTLLGTTALISASLVVSAGGPRAYGAGGATLDNGVTVGVALDDQVDEVSASFKRSWGEMRFGDDITTTLGYLIPRASNLFGVDSPDFGFGNDANGGNGAFRTNDTLLDISSDATKIIYFTPAFGGFKFGVSYAPDRRGGDQYGGVLTANNPGGTSFSSNAGQIQDAFSAALEFDQSFGDIGFASGAAFEERQRENPYANQDSNSWGVSGHLDLNFSGFVLGGAAAYRSNWNTLSAGSDLLIFGVGATYNWDLWTVGLGWSHGEYEYSSSKDDDQLDIIEFTGRYDLMPGISLDAMVGMNNLDASSVSGRSDNTSWQAGMGFYIGF